ncbi:MAG: hypothetical protein ACERLG_00580 [Sedimentibacter sp.]
MKYEMQKISRIVDVMMNFYLHHSAKKMNMSIEDDNDKYILIFDANEISCSDALANQLTKLLNIERQREVEEIYWQLGGNDNDGEEINLVGMMVDEVKIDFKCPSLKIKLIRYKDNKK